jgi:hypothetical protein
LDEGGRQRVRGLQSDEVAELLGVRPRVYQRFEDGEPHRRFSPEFVRRVAEALRLDDRERIALFRLASPTTRIAVEQVEHSANDGALCHLAKVRALARRMSTASSFEEAASGAVRTVAEVLAPTCATAGILATEGDDAAVVAAGPRADRADAGIAESCIPVNESNRSGATTYSESRCTYRETLHGAFAFWQRATDGRAFLVVVTDAEAPAGFRPAATLRATPYWERNARLAMRSALTHGLFENGGQRGNLCALWTDPRTMNAPEIELLRTASALVELTAAGSQPEA